MKKRMFCLILSLALCLGLALPAAASFSDVPASHWAYDSVNYVTEKGLFNGTSATTFSPNSTMTRAMLITVLYRYAGSPAVEGTVASATAYTDVANGAYYADAVIWGVEHGIFPTWFRYNSRNVTDVSTTFQPNAVVNRAEFASMLYSFMQDAMGDKADETDTAVIMDYLDSEPGCQFTDMTADAIYQSMPEIASHSIERDVVFGIINVMMGWAYPNGILTGTSDTTMSPEGSVTRAQVAAMLARFYQKYGEATHVEKPAVPAYTLTLSSQGRLELNVGDTEALIASTEPYVAGLSYTCASSAPSVVKVAAVNIGAANKWELTGLAAGTAVVTVTDSNGKSTTLTVEVKEAPAGQTEKPSSASYTEQVIQLVNAQRAQNGLAPLQTNSAISEAARIRAGELPSLFEHTRPDGSTCFTVLSEVGLRYGTAGENIAAGYATPEQVVEGWMNSPGHRANILNGSFTTIGVGYNSEGNYWVQLFIG